MKSIWFYTDVVSCIPFELMGQEDAENMTAVKTLKLFRLTRISKLFKRIAKNAKSAGASLQVSMLLFSIVFAIAPFGCDSKCDSTFSCYRTRVRVR